MDFIENIYKLRNTIRYLGGTKQLQSKGQHTHVLEKKAEMTFCESIGNSLVSSALWKSLMQWHGPGDTMPDLNAAGNVRMCVQLVVSP